MKRKAPTTEEIEKALKAADAGKGRQLAMLVKSFSVEDLAAAFSAVGKSGFNFYAISTALHFAAGRKGYREEHAAEMRAFRKRKTVEA